MQKSDIMNFSPTVYLFTGLLQTAFNSFRKPKQVNYNREYIKLQDGGQISLDWAKPITYQKDENIENIYNINQKNNKSNNDNFKKEFRIEREYEPQNDQKIMFIVHGLTGGSDGNYIQQLVRTCQKNGFRVVAYNSRGVNNQMTSPMPNNGVDLSDLDIALNKVKERYPEAPVFAVGTSFGGNQILRWTAQQQKENGYCFLKGVIGLSVPFDVQNVMNNMDAK
ncbi:hypothetical protein PPERSA_04970 [Pseudocohnilembus persalinus]|uniref:AB hydrolase-1 domain-containing protein n=1 Tax=Pseudocohnilembus persalinus TaxID=266149 RepID=A0A0V0QWV7_PSEPJ|nr:hypothetical protein PPERSA_04970 [Pseudocohnilembus persalinus]|eukprot:KRX06357.1 hypothetical protein PPERSA_04970 [Pseudocohnilembus persalinus]